MAQNIILKRSATSGKIPTTASLALGELAINTYDGKAFLKQSGSEHKVLTLLATDNNGNINYTGSLKLTASFAATASYINPLNQAVTITGSVTISGSTTQVGNNTLFGNTLLTGSITISGSTTTPSTPTIRVSGDMETDGVIKFLPVNRNINTSISASYIYVSGSTQDLYFSQNGRGYNNVTRLRWLEGNLYTGLLHGGLITTQSSTTFNISSGSGIIVNINASLNDDPYPTIQYINWGNLTNQSLTYLTSSIQTFVGINSSGTVIQQTDPWYNGQYNTSLSIGTVLHQNTASINGSITYPNVAYGYKQRTYDFIKAFGSLKLSGYTIYTSSSLGLTIGSGTAWSDGRNYQVDPNNPSYITDPGTNVSKIFRYYVSSSTYIQDTNGGVGYTVIDPANYNNNGVLTPVPGTGGNRRWSNQRVFYYPNSVTKGIVVYYGSATYASEIDAAANLPYENFQETPNTQQNAIYLGAIAIRNDGVFTDSTSYRILPGGVFRNVGGSGGGGAVTTILSGLSDVSISGPTNGEALVYSNTTAKWENKSFISASISGNADTATTASFAITASYVLNAVSSSFASTSSYVLNAVSSSFATTASFAIQALSASFATTASYVLNAISASNANTLDGLDSSDFIRTSTVQTITGNKSFRDTTFFGLEGLADGKITFVEQTAGLSSSISIDAEANLIIQNGEDLTLVTVAQNGDGVTLASGTFTGNLTGNADTATTASYVLNAVSASYAPSSGASFPFTGSAGITGSLVVEGPTGVSGSQFLSGSLYFTRASSPTAAGTIGLGAYGLSLRGINGASGAHFILTNGAGDAALASPSSTRHINVVGRLSAGLANFVGTPSAKLHVVGEGATSATTTLLIQNSTPTQILTVNDAGEVTITGSLGVRGTGTLAQFGAGLSSGVYLQNSAANTGLITAVNNTPAEPSASSISIGANFGLNGSTTNFYGIGLGALRNAKYDMWFQTGNTNGGGYRWYTGGINERMTMDYLGNLGIGTSTPNTRLDVNGNTTITGSFTVITGSNVELQVLNTGVRLGNIITDAHTVTGSLGVSGSLNINGNTVITGSATNSLLVRGSGATASTTGLLTLNSSGTQTFKVYDTAAGQIELGPGGTDNTTRINGQSILTQTIGVWSSGHYITISAGTGLFGLISQGVVGARASALVRATQTMNSATTDYIQSQFGSTPTISPATGSAQFNAMVISPIVSQSIAAIGITRGLQIWPTLTRAQDWRTLEWNNDTGFGLYGSGSAPNVIRGSVTIGSLITGSSNLNVAGTTRLSGSFNTAASGSVLTVIGSGSGLPIFTVQGSQGELFSVTDSLSGSLFSVNDISGLPILEVFSDNTILMGDYQDPMLLTTKKIAQTNSGSFIIYSIPTASYDGAFIDYTIKSGSNARAGTIMSTWANSSIQFTEVDTIDIGSTAAVGLTMILSGSNAVMTGSSSTGAWTIRTIIRAI